MSLMDYARDNNSSNGNSVEVDSMNNCHTTSETGETNTGNNDNHDQGSAEQTRKINNKNEGVKQIYFPPNTDITKRHSHSTTPSSGMMHTDTPPDPGKYERRKTWSQVWYDFSQSTTVHGLRQVGETQPYMIRRFIWIVIVLTGLAMFLYQMLSGIMYYYTYPVSVNVKINHNDTVIFPAMTICNQNAFRKTIAAENDWYFLLSDMYSGDLSGVDLLKYNASELVLYDIYNTAGHDKNDIIVSCVWDNKPCLPDDFVTSMTDYGKCYTFNADAHMARNASRTGTDGGLRLLVNVEQYEYMPGPNQGAGLRVHLHSQLEAPLVSDFGITMPPGSYSLLGMTLIRIQNLPHPHGRCDDTRTLQYFDSYSKKNCLEECKQNYLGNYCHCKHINMVNDTGSKPYCNLTSYQNCVQQASGRILYR